MVTIKYNNVYLNDYFTIASPDEEKGAIKNANMYIKDYFYGEKTAEKAEGKMQRVALNNLKGKDDVDVIIGGELANQLGIMHNTLKDYDTSFLGVYSACASFIESLIIGANMISSKAIKKAGILTSSHILTSERQFRFPNEYGSLKSCYTTVTITAAIAALISSKSSKRKLVAATIGSVTDYNVTDVANMGAIMAPAAAKTIFNHLNNRKMNIDDFDVILTGDLGSLGLDLLNIVLHDEYGIDANDKVTDAGSLIYECSQHKYMGGSGPTVIPYVFFNKILKSKNYKRILLVGTGALHSPTMVNQKNSIPSIAHAIEIEVE